MIDGGAALPAYGDCLIVGGPYDATTFPRGRLIGGEMIRSRAPIAVPVIARHPVESAVPRFPPRYDEHTYTLRTWQPDADVRTFILIHDSLRDHDDDQLGSMVRDTLTKWRAR